MTLRERLLRPGRHWVLVSVAMYVLACILPAVEGPSRGDSTHGYRILGMLSWNDPMWLANPAFFVAVIAALSNRVRISAALSIIAVILAEVILALDCIRMALIVFRLPMIMHDLLPGSFIWMSSLQTLACHELWRVWLDKRRRDYEHDVGAGGSAAEGDAAH